MAGSVDSDKKPKDETTVQHNNPTQAFIISSNDVLKPRSPGECLPISSNPLSEPSSPSGQENHIVTIEESKSPSYDEKSYHRDLGAKLLSSRTFSIPLGPPPSYDSFSSTISSKLRLRPLKAIKSNRKVTTWGIHWYMPSCMLIGILAGLLTAVGHHLYNSRLNANQVGDPTWPQRFGSAFSFFVKFCLVGSVEIAYKQRVWMTVKKRDFQVKTLDGVFSACNDPFQFLNPELVFKATVPALLAALFWVLPLCAIASPASLTSISSVTNYTTTCNNIQSIDFQRENGFALQSITDSHPALAFYSWSDQQNNSGALWYDEPSTELTRVSTLSLISRTGPISLESPCEGASNCSYSFSFYGPSYNCVEVSNFTQEAGNMTIEAMVPFPGQSNIYFGESDDYENKDTGAPTPVSPTNASATIPWNGVFTKEPSMYIGWVENTTQLLPPDPSSPWAFLLIPHVMQCTLYNASYDYTISFLNGLMQIESQKVNLIAPLLEENTTIMAPDDASYGAFSAYHAMGFIYRNMLSSSIDQYTDKGDPTNTQAMSSSSVSQTTLVDPRTQFAVSNFPQAVELGFQNMTFSLLSDTSLHSHITITAPCTTTKQILIWHYAPFWLVLSYSLAILTTILAAAIGAHAFRSNGYSIDTNFSTFLATTRNGSLDRVVRDRSACLGQEPLDEAFKEVRLRFGDVGGVDEGRGPGHTAFGFPNETRAVVFGDNYV